MVKVRLLKALVAADMGHRRLLNCHLQHYLSRHSIRIETFSFFFSCNFRTPDNSIPGSIVHDSKIYNLLKVNQRNLDDLLPPISLHAYRNKCTSFVCGQLLVWPSTFKRIQFLNSLASYSPHALWHQIIFPSRPTVLNSRFQFRTFGSWKFSSWVCRGPRHKCTPILIPQFTSCCITYN